MRLVAGVSTAPHNKATVCGRCIPAGRVAFLQAPTPPVGALPPGSLDCDSTNFLWVAVLSALLLWDCPAVPPPPSEEDGGGLFVAPKAACDAGSYQDAQGECQAAGWTACGKGFGVDSSGWGCDAVPTASCDSGSMAVPGEGCAAIGWAQCPPGLPRDGSGWGCEPTLPRNAPAPGRLGGHRLQRLPER